MAVFVFLSALLVYCTVLYSVWLARCYPLTVLTSLHVELGRGFKVLTMCNLKEQCHKIFNLYFFSLIQPIWAPDKQANMVFLKHSFLRRYSNFKFEKFDSTQANTARIFFFF